MTASEAEASEATPSASAPTDGGGGGSAAHGPAASSSVATRISGPTIAPLPFVAFADEGATGADGELTPEEAKSKILAVLETLLKMGEIEVEHRQKMEGMMQKLHADQDPGLAMLRDLIYLAGRYDVPIGWYTRKPGGAQVFSVAEEGETLYPFQRSTEQIWPALPGPINQCPSGRTCPVTPASVRAFCDGDTGLALDESRSCAAAKAHGCPLWFARTKEFTAADAKKLGKIFTGLTDVIAGAGIKKHGHRYNLYFSSDRTRLHGYVMPSKFSGATAHVHRIDHEITPENLAATSIRVRTTESVEQPHVHYFVVDLPHALGELIPLLDHVPAVAIGDYIQATYGSAAGMMHFRAFEAAAKPIDISQMPTYQLKGVQVFMPGRWNGDEYTAADIDELAQNAELLRDRVKPMLKLGHSNDLVLKEGLPAVGWATRVYTQDGVLLADFDQVPKLIYDLVQKGGYKRVSAEIFTNYQDTEPETGKRRSYGKVLRGVALLGGDTPAVDTLQDVALLYSFGRPPAAGQTVKTYTITTAGGGSMSQNEPTRTPPAAPASASEADRKIAALMEQNRKLQEQMRQNEIANFTDRAKREGRILPAQESELTGILMDAYRATDAMGDEGLKAFTAAGGKDLPTRIKLFVDSLKPQVILDELGRSPAATSEGVLPGTTPAAPAQAAGATATFTDPKNRSYPIAGSDLHQKVRDLQKANPGMSYADAMTKAGRQSAS